MGTSKVGIAMANELYEATLEMVRKRQAIMFAEANAACDAIWAENVRRMDGPNDERLNYIVRVQERSVGITAVTEKRAAAERARWQAERDDEEQMLGL